MHRILIALAGLAGASGVGLAAAGAHLVQGRNVDTAALILMVHAPALLALALGGKPSPRLLSFAGLAIAVGLALFSGDLMLRATLGRPLFPSAAPAGGAILIGAWFAIALAAFLRK